MFGERLPGSVRTPGLLSEFTAIRGAQPMEGYLREIETVEVSGHTAESKSVVDRWSALTAEGQSQPLSQHQPF